MRILVTGANGYLGQGVVKQLLDDGFEVAATDFSGQFIDERADKYEVNLFEIDNPFEYFGRPNVVLHMAWRDGFKHASINHINDLPKHYAFLASMIEHGVDRVCVMGSMHEVGFYEGSIDENTPTNPMSLYGISKNALRNSVKILADEKGVIFQWIRGFYIVGNSINGCSIFSKIVQAANEGKKKFPFTMGLNQFDFIDFDTFCQQVAAVAEQDDINGIINCCSGRPMKLSERVESFIAENGFDIKLQYGAFPDRPYDSKAIWGNDAKINEIMRRKHNS
ncbi:MAG: NAD-dependent epimerase/dehydratase family protein [Lachnospiraceae bacterium]|nr:NAD-dependent epimerase/dehydratase family protein [Lachnospiraceae bacterium]